MEQHSLVSIRQGFLFYHLWARTSEKGSSSSIMIQVYTLAPTRGGRIGIWRLGLGFSAQLGVLIAGGLVLRNIPVLLSRGISSVSS